MCQLFAMNSSQPVSVHLALRTFTARGGHTGDHVDGWGIAFHDRRGSRVLLDHRRAVDSALAAYLCRHPVHATTVLAHVRKATRGQVTRTNCHPFQREWRGRRWSFCHNGTLHDFAPALTGSDQPSGQTDSEHAFCWLLQQLRSTLHGAGAPHWRDVAPLLAELASRIGRHGVFNFTLTDGEALYALGASRLSWQQRPLARDARQPVAPGGRAVQIATEPLDSAEPWQAFAPGELMVFEHGEPVWSHQLDLPAHPMPAANQTSAALAA